MSEKPFEVIQMEERREREKDKRREKEKKKTSAGPRHSCAYSVLLQQSLRVKEATPHTITRKKKETLSRDIVH